MNVTSNLPCCYATGEGVKIIMPTFCIISFPITLQLLIQRWNTKERNIYIYIYLNMAFRVDVFPSHQRQVSRGWMQSTRWLSSDSCQCTRWLSPIMASTAGSTVTWVTKETEKNSQPIQTMLFLFLKGLSTLTVQKKRASPRNTLPCLT